MADVLSQSQIDALLKSMAGGGGDGGGGGSSAAKPEVSAKAEKKTEVEEIKYPVLRL